MPGSAFGIEILDRKQSTHNTRKGYVLPITVPYEKVCVEGVKFVKGGIHFAGLNEKSWEIRRLG